MIAEIKTVEEFIERLIQRRLSGVRAENLDLPKYLSWKEIIECLKEEDFKKDPVDITDSIFINVNLDGIYLPYLKGKNFQFNGSLRKAYLANSELENGVIEGDLSHIVFSESLWRNITFRPYVKISITYATQSKLFIPNTETPEREKDLQRIEVKKRKLGIFGRGRRRVPQEVKKERKKAVSLEYGKVVTSSQSETRQTSLEFANLRYLRYDGGKLEANVRGADFYGAHLIGIELGWAKNLKEAKNLEYALFFERKGKDVPTIPKVKLNI